MARMTNFYLMHSHLGCFLPVLLSYDTQVLLYAVFLHIDASSMLPQKLVVMIL